MATLVDSLPYIDPEGDSAAIDALIQAELAAGPPPPDPNDPSLTAGLDIFKDRPGLLELLNTVSNGSKIQAIDTNRLRLPSPSTTTTSADSSKDWLKAVQNAQSQLEHQTQRITNLELMSRFGANAWRIHGHQIEAAVKSTRAECSRLEKEMQELNRVRRVEQEHIRPTLESLEKRRFELIHSIVAIRFENDRLDTEIDALEAALGVAAAAGSSDTTLNGDFVNGSAMMH